MTPSESLAKMAAARTEKLRRAIRRAARRRGLRVSLYSTILPSAGQGRAILSGRVNAGLNIGVVGEYKPWSFRVVGSLREFLDFACDVLVDDAERRLAR